jgi:P4 family phage/plasmid primase-like protien
VKAHRRYMIPLRTFLQSRYVKDGDWNITGMPNSPDMGKYKIADEDYDTFLSTVHAHTFGHPPNTNSLLERHREHGPILVDIDLRYGLGQPLRRRFTPDVARNFVCQYIATMIYFSRVDDLPSDLLFYYMVKPSPESDPKSHKDGIHIQCPSISTSPKYQYGIRGSMIERNVLPSLFPDTLNHSDDIFDLSVIHRNNWFLYGACKPSKAQYTVGRIWRLAIADVKEALDDGDPLDANELVESVSAWLTEESIPADTLGLMKTLSIRRGHDRDTAPTIRTLRQLEWEELMIAWGAGKKATTTAPARNVVEWNPERESVDLSGASYADLNASVPEQEIALAYKLARECINPELRAGGYHEWVRLAFLLKNIADTEDSFRVWMDVSNSAVDIAGKPRMTEADLRRKWDLLRIGSSDKKLTIRSLMHWANEDNPAKLRNLLSKNLQVWILQRAENTHVSVAEIVHNVYRYEFASSLQGKKGNYEWFHYAKGTHAWKAMKQPIELRASLSGRVRNEFSSAIRAIREQHESINDDGVNVAHTQMTEETTKRADEFIRMGMPRLLAEKTAAEEIKLKNKSKTKSTEKKKPSDLDMKRETLESIERNLQTTGFKDCVLKECGEMFYDNDFLSKLNCNPYLVGVSNGVLDLHYTERDPITNAIRPTRVHFRPGVPEDSISFQMGRMEPDLDAIPYIPWSEIDETVKEELASFFARIYPDPVLCKYVLTLLASCLEGQNKEQKFYVNQGGGSNGKSMIQNLMEFVFGDYQTSLQTTVLTRKRPESGAANPDMITVKCRRYIYMGEPDPGEKLNTSRMKQFSGDDRIEARPLFGDQEKFNMMGKLFLSCNDKPEISSMDNGTWRRIRVIPHVSTFKDPGDPTIDPAKNIYPKDLMLKHKLREWRVAFLSMLVHYYETEYLPYGLKEPEIVLEASNKYKEENDVFMKFFGESFAREEGAPPLAAAQVRTRFREWKAENRGVRVDLKEAHVMDRMRMMGSQGSTDKLFLGLRLNVQTDLSGAHFLSHMPVS